jgi:hypothetical protein
MASRHADLEILIHPEPVRDMGVAFSSEECVGVVFITIVGVVIVRGYVGMDMLEVIGFA